MVAPGFASAASTALPQSPVTATTPARSASSSGSTSGRVARTCARTGSPTPEGTGVAPTPACEMARTAPASSPPLRASSARRATCVSATTTAARASPAAASKAASQPGFDLDDVEQRANHTVEIGEVCGAGSLTGTVERQRQGLGASRPAVMLGSAGGRLVLERHDRGLGGFTSRERRDCLLDQPVDGVVRRAPFDREGGWPRRRGARPSSAGCPAAPSGDGCRSRCAPSWPGAQRARRGSQPLRWSPHRRRRPSRIRNAARAVASSAVARSSAPLSVSAPRPSASTSTSSALSWACSASREATTAWSTNALRSRSMPRRRSVRSDCRPFARSRRRLVAHEGVAEVVATHRGQLGFGGQHLGVEAGEHARGSRDRRCEAPAGGPWNRRAASGGGPAPGRPGAT